MSIGSEPTGSHLEESTEALQGAAMKAAQVLLGRECSNTCNEEILLVKYPLENRSWVEEKWI